MNTLATVAALPLAITKEGVGNYVSALFAVYTILILLNILISFVPRMPYHPWLRVVLDFITETTNPYLNIFRSIMRPLGGPGGMAIDFSPILAILVLGIVGGIVVGAFFLSDRVARAWGLAAALCVVVLIIDQVVKDVIEHHIVLGEQVNVLGPLKLTQSHNEGVAFGLANGGGVGLVIVTVIALGVVIWLFSRDPTRPGMWVATGLLAGGALGNLVDRIRHGHVTDFIELPHWPPFNLADCAITCGVVILLFIYIREAERAERES